MVMACNLGRFALFVALPRRRCCSAEASRKFTATATSHSNRSVRPFNRHRCDCVGAVALRLRSTTSKSQFLALAHLPGDGRPAHRRKPPRGWALRFRGASNHQQSQRRNLDRCGLASRSADQKEGSPSWGVPCSAAYAMSFNGARSI